MVRLIHSLYLSTNTPITDRKWSSDEIDDEDNEQDMDVLPHHPLGTVNSSGDGSCGGSGNSSSSSSSSDGVAVMSMAIPSPSMNNNNNNNNHSNNHNNNNDRDIGADFDDARYACLELQQSCKKKGKTS